MYQTSINGDHAQEAAASFLFNEKERHCQEVHGVYTDRRFNGLSCKEPTSPLTC
jgi:hypothetical protein